jgi:hypothetical protein
VPLYVCEACGTLDNTAIGPYWPRVRRRRGDPTVRILCSPCAVPGVEWHGLLPRTQYDPELHGAMDPATRLIAGGVGVEEYD